MHRHALSSKNSKAGFREIEHTADWELEVWASDLPSLLEQAARGMYTLSGILMQTGPRHSRTVIVQSQDSEGLLVSFLTELLFLIERESLAFDSFRFSQDGDRLEAILEGYPILYFDKEIKAVTYHQMKIHETETGLSVNIVFDV